MNIIQALDDPNVFGAFFRGPTWVVWRVFLAVLFGLPLTSEQLALYTKHTGRTVAPTSPLHEAWLVCGRRAGKSFILACVAIFLAAFKDWRPFLAPGEVGTIMIVAADRKQARVIMRYCLGLLKSVPMLAQLIEAETRESVTLRNRIVVEVHTANHRATRGYAILCACLDECAYFPTDEASAEPDVEIINAIKPGMATIPGAVLLCASSPHARKGALWSAYAKHYGKDNDPVLVWQAATRDMNATVPQSYIDSHMEEDPARASAEYLAMFRSDLEAFVSREVIETCVGDYYELSPEAGRSYYAFVDPAGGSGGDSFALAIAHREGNGVVVDLVRERKPPFMPSQVIDEFVPLLKSYRIGKVTGDRWAGGFPPEAFQKGGIRYEPSKQVKSDFYRDALAMLNSGRIVLPKHHRLFNQLVSLERHVARGGHDVIDHPRDGHDDLANACMAVAVLAGSFGGYTLELLGRATQWGDEPAAGPSFAEQAAERRHAELMRRYGQPVSLNPLPRG
jgi:hypothetical protein